MLVNYAKERRLKKWEVKPVNIQIPDPRIKDIKSMSFELATPIEYITAYLEVEDCDIATLEKYAPKIQRALNDIVLLFKKQSTKE